MAVLVGPCRREVASTGATVNLVKIWGTTSVSLVGSCAEGFTRGAGGKAKKDVAILAKLRIFIQIKAVLVLVIDIRSVVLPI